MHYVQNAFRFSHVMKGLMLALCIMYRMHSVFPM